MGIAACLVLGGLVFGGVYLLTRDDGGAEESTIENGSRIGSGGAIPNGGSSGNGGGGSSPASPTERGFPTDSEPALRAEAEELLREFHVALVESDFQYAWSLLSSRKRRQEAQEKAYSGWKEAQATLTPYLLPGGIHVEIDELEDEGVARVLVTGMGWTQPGSACSEWSGLTWVRYEGGSWRYDPGYSTTAERRRGWEGRSGELMGVGC